MTVEIEESEVVVVSRVSVGWVEHDRHRTLRQFTVTCDACHWRAIRATALNAMRARNEHRCPPMRGNL